MLFKNENNDKINEEQIKLVENAQRRVKQKNILFYHFSLMFFGNISLLTINLLFNFKEQIVFFNYPWSYLAVSFWFLLFSIHTYNVYITNRFMGKNWEKEQISVLVTIWRSF